MSMSKVIELARRELGVTEDPKGSNRVKYNTAYYGREVSGKDFPWCVVFLWWVFQKAGERMAFFGWGQDGKLRDSAAVEGKLPVQQRLPVFREHGSY